MADLHAPPESPIRNQRGFTLIELMVAFAIFAILLAAMVSFYKFQSSLIAGASKRKTSHEVTTSALAAIKRDIMQAGTGLRGKIATGSSMRPQSQMAVYVDYHETSKPQDPDALYVNCTDYLDMSLPQDGFPNSFFSETSIQGQDKIWFDLESGKKIKTVDKVPAHVGHCSMNSAILIPDDGTDAYVETMMVSPDACADPPDRTGVDPTENTKTVTLTFETDNKGSIKRYAAPAISYVLSLNDTDVSKRGRLLRNGEPMIGGVLKAGQIPTVKVTDFKIRCQFRAAAGGTTWADLKYSGTTNTADQLLLIEVTLRYLVRDVKGGYATPHDGPPGFRIEGDTTGGPWAVGGTRTITVSPRCLVLMQYL